MSARKDIQAKHIPDRGVLEEIRRLRATPWPGGQTNDTYDRWVMLHELSAAPAFPAKVVRAKLAALIRRGFLSGCTCGCRGDFELTEAGEAFLDAPQPPPAPADTSAGRPHLSRMPDHPEHECSTWKLAPGQSPAPDATYVCETCGKEMERPATTPCPGCEEPLALEQVLAHSCGYQRPDG